MEPETEDQSRQRRFAATERLLPLGFRPLGRWLYQKDGVTYDLSAANLDRIETIVREGQFVVPAAEVHGRLMEAAYESRGAELATTRRILADLISAWQERQNAWHREAKLHFGGERLTALEAKIEAVGQCVADLLNGIEESKTCKVN